MGIDEQILKAYNDVGFSKSKVYKKLKKDGVVVTQKQVNEVLSKQDTEQLHKIQKKATGGHITAFSVDELWQVDLLDMFKFSKKNKGYKWILISVDVFTRQAAAIPVKSKSKDDMHEAMETLLKGGAPVEIMSDNGVEFMNNKVQELLRTKAVNHNVNAVGDHKALAVIDSFSRTLKAMLHKHFTHSKDTVWVDKLDEFLNIYNKNDHTGLPADLAPDDTIQTVENETGVRIQNEEKQTKSIKSDISVGSRVRERIIKTFKKGTEASFSKEIYTVKSVARVKATITDSEGNEKSVRLENLQLVADETIARQSDPVAEATKKRKTEIKLNQEGVNPDNVVKSDYNIGDKIQVKILDENGKKKWYKGTIIKKIRNKHRIEWDNGDEPENLNLENEEVKKMKK